MPNLFNHGLSYQLIYSIITALAFEKIVAAFENVTSAVHPYSSIQRYTFSCCNSNKWYILYTSFPKMYLSHALRKGTVNPKANSIGPDQMLQNAASDQALHC